MPIARAPAGAQRVWETGGGGCARYIRFITG